MTEPTAPATDPRAGTGDGTADDVIDATTGDAGLRTLAWIIGTVPVVVRARTQGLLPSALLVTAAAAAVWWFVPSRWKAPAAVATALGAGVILLPTSLGLAMGVFTVAGVVITDTVPHLRITRDARVVMAAGLLTGSILLLGGRLVTVPTAVVLAGIVTAAVVHRVQPTWLRRTLDSVIEAGRPTCTRSTRALRRVAAQIDSWRTGPRPHPAPGRWVLVTACSLAVIGIVVAVRDQRFTLIDDAAITFRYAVRIASGDGFTYNDGDATNGASAPLYTLLLSLGHLVFRDVEAFARTLGVVCYGVTVGLVTAILGRTRGLIAATVGGVVLVTSVAYRTEALTGMESGFAAMLGMLVIFLLMEGHITWAGVVLGLAIVNKVDAGFLAVAVGTATWLVHRRPPWRLAATAAATAAPWFLFSLLYFGSVLPFSATQKLGGEVANPDNQYDPLWIFRRLEADRMDLLLVAGLVLTVLVAVRLIRLETSASVALLSCGLWVLLHGGAFSLIDLGDPYPWYATVLFAPLVVAGTLAVFVLADQLSAAVTTAAVNRGREWSQRTVGHLLAGALVLALLITLRPGIGEAGRVLRDGHDTTDFELFEDARRRGGQYVGENAEPREVVESCYGWVAFGALDNPFRETCPLSTQIDPGPPTWMVESYLDDQELPERRADRELVETFGSPLGVTLVYRAEG